MYGMEYSQIIHSSGRIKWQIDHMKRNWAEHFSAKYEVKKNACANIGRVLDIKSDRLLGSNGNPRFSSLLSIVHAFGLELGVRKQKTA